MILSIFLVFFLLLGCISEQLRDEISDMKKKTILLELKASHLKKQIKQWNEVTESFKRLSLVNTVPKQPKFTKFTQVRFFFICSN